MIWRIRMNQESGKKIIYVVKAFLLSVIVTIISLMAVAGMLYKGTVQNEQLKFYIFLIYFMASLVGGVYMGKKSERKRFLWGTVYGIMFFCSILLFSILVNGGKVEGNIILPAIICAIGGMLGGMLGH